MTILCIETSTSVCSAAICRDGMPAEQYIGLEGSNHARLLPRYIQQLIDLAKSNAWSIDAIAISQGPGSYTGLRIGTSTAKGLCYGLQVPLIPIPTLQIMAAVAKEHIDAQALLCPMMDARRMEVYSAIYNPQLQPLTEVQAIIVDGTFSQQTTQQTYYFGDGAAKCQEIITSPQWIYIPDIYPQAAYMGPLAEKAIHTSVECAYYEPFYLKEFVAAQSHVKGLK